ncbi:1-aminocyclopropane-1-carboxylate deaminase/D-cysteine desulfhydrase [Colwelliaceae bacterium BS250]
MNKISGLQSLNKTSENFSAIEQISQPILDKFAVQLFIKRDDLIHPIISGNKWRKLKYNIEQAKQLGKRQIISFGGAFSNHIHALAFACHQHNLQSIGIIRGEVEYQANFTLSWAQHWGMQLNFVDRKTYKLRTDTDYLTALQQKYPQAFIVPEGGSNQFALPGVGEVMTELKQQLEFSHLLAPVGSGGTLAGLIKADDNQHQLLGIAVLKQQGYLADEVNELLGDSYQNFTNWQLMSQFHRGGYGKYKSEDAARILAFSQATNIPFEPVYSGKMLLAFLDLLAQGYFPAGSKIVLLHTGGMQGLGGMLERGLLSSEQWPVPAKAPK